MHHNKKSEKTSVTSGVDFKNAALTQNLNMERYYTTHHPEDQVFKKA